MQKKYTERQVSIILKIINDDKKIDRLKEIKEELRRLKEEADRIEGEIILETKQALENTKYKTLTQSTENGSSVTVTVSESVKIVYCSMLRHIFGAAYPDMVIEETKYKLTEPAKRLLGNMWTGRYIRSIGLADAINQLPVDEKTRKKLEKRLKGIKFETDKKNLINIGGLSEKDAGEYAYLLQEAATWQQFKNLLNVTERVSDEDIDTMIDLINSSIIVDESPKVSVE